ncbi:glycosyltransferase family 4 protein [Mannheimia sp. AT1]|uniref:Glycosyltransferase family 4 protein n=1 Tax=Mannheimia cairinae TaxID=3025936 RepID=A0ABT5MND3_9PAST|nr:glycosyltransferase family 4 protein [Mannheimia cairinae]MDD0823695.1 glycosyltransferase family 4 protein [Mannheimia cairinae]MDD0825373.1 glycosyltransferase family 4 protein [Mannheimia cairinae]
MKYNISMVINKFKNGGGTERYILDLVNGFYDLGIHPNVYAMKFDKSITEYKKIQAYKITLNLIPKILKNFFFSQAIQRRKKNKEITLSAAYTDGDILFCGGQYRGYLNALNKTKTFSASIKIKMEQRALNNSKVIVAHSKLMKKELIELYNIPSNKIEVLYPPLDIEKFKIIDDSQRKNLRKKFGFKDNETIYLFPSTGHKRKGFEILANYFKNSSLPIRLVVAGTPVKDDKNITSLGFRKDMPELYQAADFTIMASIYEPFGLVGLESIFSGTPIIFSENMACLEALKGDFGYTFDRNVNESLNNAIRNSLKNKYRINNPYSLIDYDPTLENHLKNLLKIIEKLQ